MAGPGPAMTAESKTRELRRAFAHVRHREEAPEDQRDDAGVLRHVILAGGNEHEVARHDRDLAALSMSLPRAGEHADHLLELVMQVRSASGARLRHRDG